VHELVRFVEDLSQHGDCHTRRRLAHIATVAVREETAVAAVAFGVSKAIARANPISRTLQYVDERVLLPGSWLPYNVL
jgi:hypothetical protein